MPAINSLGLNGPSLKAKRLLYGNRDAEEADYVLMLW